jgi:hypothetical protein
LKMMRWAVVTSDCGAVENLKVGARWGFACIHTCIYTLTYTVLLVNQ